MAANGGGGGGVNQQLVHAAGNFRSYAAVAAFHAEWANRICNITVRGQGQAGLGTGFLVNVGDNIPCLLTNNHVLPTRQAARDSDVIAGRDGNRVRVDIDPNIRFVTNAELDYTLVALGQLPPGFQPADLLAVTQDARLHVPVRIFQAPGGGQVVTSTGITTAVSAQAQPPHVLYTADTNAGSSGAPVLDDQGLSLIALHHQAVNIVQNERQQPRNRGVLMTAINTDIFNQLHVAPPPPAHYVGPAPIAFPPAPAYAPPVPAPRPPADPAPIPPALHPQVVNAAIIRAIHAVAAGPAPRRPRANPAAASQLGDSPSANHLNMLTRDALQNIIRRRVKFDGVPLSGNKADLIRGLRRCGITFDDLTVDDLKEICCCLDLPVSGTKPELIDRLLRRR